MEPDFVEIAPCSRTLTPKKAVTQEVIDVEQYEMQNGGVLPHNNVVDNKNKGKAIQFGSFPYDAGSADDSYGASSKIEIPNGLLEDTLMDDDDFGYPYQAEWEVEADDYSMYQDLYDSKDIPTGVEMAMAWFPNPSGNETAKPSETSNKHGIKPEATSSSYQEATAGNGFQTQNLFPHVAAAPFFHPWIPTPPYNSQGGVVPSSPYQGLHYAALQWMNHSNHIQPQTPTPVMEGAAPFPGHASSGLLLPGPQNKSGFKGYHRYRPKPEEVLSAPDPSREKRNMEDFLGSYLFFKRFDIVEDYSDHHFASSGSTSKPYTKDWAKRIQEEWRSLENDLPEMIFVRAYESRMDLLRAVIIGAEGTPYHDGLFFFDIFFPDTYPSVPPAVHYRSRGLRINPNLYKCGKVCLSLLGTWTGSQREQWIPNNSTMLQVLVSIQGLILNQKPYFNEPGYEMSAGTPVGESSSNAYSENTFLHSLRTMVYSIRTPPKYFEDFAYGHFFSCAHDVLKACNAYRNGAPVGSVVKGGVQDVEEISESCSKRFRTDVATFVDTLLVKEFILLGVVGLEPEGEDKPSASGSNVGESSQNIPKRGRVSSSN